MAHVENFVDSEVIFVGLSMPMPITFEKDEPLPHPHYVWILSKEKGYRQSGR
jgi:hypothetical protein